MSTTFTVRIPKHLARKMKEHKEINWSEVVRKAIEEYLKTIEETETRVPASKILGELLAEGIKPEDLQPLEPEKEKELYKKMVKKEWRRHSMIQAQ
jgi:Arc/MetJ-type ribon-helix-helix transcriptional regulator